MLLKGDCGSAKGLLLARGGAYPDFRLSGVGGHLFGPLTITF
jgi:hypothetical protein